MTESKRGGRRNDDHGGNGMNEKLRAVLRQGDPAADDAPPAVAETAALRRRIIDAANSSSTSTWRPNPALASALVAVTVLAVASLLWFGPIGNGSPPRVADRAAADQPADDRTMVDQPPVGGADTDAGPSAVADLGPAGNLDTDAPPSIRNVQFVTQGGTRIVWVLNRNLDI